ncbi:MAG: putative sugar nucleotidyl transferase [Gemmataceae bacterium]|nr:putative sugar nucleotidyl transferase [Gemmataceae bacterium]
MRVCLVEDTKVEGLEPVVSTRPVWELLCGVTPLETKQRRAARASEVGYWCRPQLQEWVCVQRGGAAVNDRQWLVRAATLLINGRWLPAGSGISIQPGERPWVAWLGDEWVCAWLEPEQLAAWVHLGPQRAMEQWKTQLPSRPATGRLTTRLWELLEWNGAEIARDVAEGEYSRWRTQLPEGVVVLGPAEWVYVHPTAEIEPQVVIDTRPGPVVIEAGACLQAFSRIEGPCAIGKGSIVYSARIRGGTTIGPQCRVGGEVENSILIGYSSKYHEGFLGHSYVGAWVNLAAGTHTSDLRCDYGFVSVSCGDGEVDSRRRKVGAFLGDHVKTGLGVLLDAGSVLEPFAQVLPSGGFAPRRISSFQRVGPSGVKLLHDIERLLRTVRIVLQRRGCELSPELERLYRYLAQRACERSASGTVLPQPVIPLRRTA